ncbi:MAG TPA: hypothetical protein VF157_05925, partial [Chloroflexota bacterium]
MRQTLCLVLGALLALSACGGVSQPASVSAPASAAPTKLHVIYSSNTGPDQVPEWAALDGGDFQK